MWEKFKKFAFKGNVMDMAIGVIIGGAFGKIVTSLVNDIIMPPIGVLIGGVNFSDLKIVLVEATETVAESSINYGIFIQTILDFFIVALSMFTVISIITKAHDKIRKNELEAAAAAASEAKAKADAEAAANKKPTTEEILTEICDILKKNQMH